MQKEKVLIIDSEVDFCLLMQMFLSKKNYDVIYFTDLPAGLKAIEMEKPQIILDRWTRQS